MRSMNYGPTARRDESNNYIFTKAILATYKNNLPGAVVIKRFHDPLADGEYVVEPGLEFQFMNGPYGGGKKFIVVTVSDDGITAREK